MGKIFSWPEIWGGRVARPQDFEIAKDTFLQQADIGISRGFFDGAFIFGSVAVGAATKRSDFDMLIALSDGNPAHYEAARELIKIMRSAQPDLVPINSIVKPVKALTDGRHEMDRYFGLHLASKDRIILGNDPAGYVTFRPKSAAAALGDYLAQKKRRLATTFTDHSPLETKGLEGMQRMLELPSKIGQKALQALAETNKSEPSGGINGGDKKIIMTRSAELMADEGLGTGFSAIVNADRAYDNLLANSRGFNTEQDAYEDFLQRLHKGLPLAIGWLEGVEKTILPKLS